MISHEQAIRAGIGAMLSDLVAASNTLIHHAGGSPQNGAFTAVAEGASSKIRLTATAHGITTGEYVAVQFGKGLAGSGYGAIYQATAINANTLDLDGSAYSSDLAQTGVWELVEDAANRWYPGVDHWAMIIARGADLTFDASGCRLKYNPAGVPSGLVRPGDPPFEDETIADGQLWMEGPLDQVQFKTNGAARLVRGG